ncbi:FAD-dependent oxidoreductase [Leptodesmis sp.]|uniref:FAD-dependent oxidoreductase n=1 Tax=Leptodesmis sp. TaxID=3100501 RepID=UPI0040534D50
MSVDYDLVVIGNSPAGIEAAIAAARLKARVALVSHSLSPVHFSEAAYHSLLQVGHSQEQWQRLQHSPLWAAPEFSSGPVQWESVQRWIELAAAHLETPHTGAVLASLGIDVIGEQGEFCRKPAPGLMVRGRFLSSRSYLLAMATRPFIPKIEGLQRTGYLTVETLPQQLPHLQEGQHLAVIGQGSEAISLAQALNRLNFSVTLVAAAPRILPDADLEVSRWLQAQLEVEGVRILTDVEITQVRSIQGKKWLQVGSQGMEVDELILAVGQTPRAESWNLEAVKVKWDGRGIWHNAKLQTTNPKIYVCEGRLGDTCYSQVARYEATIALQNALFFPRLKASYRHIPLTVYTQPEAVWMGLTEAQAISQFGKQVQVLRRSFNTLPKAQLQDNLTGFCKLIVHRHGRLLGAHLLGDQASEWSSAIALAMQQNLTIPALSRLVLPSPTWSEVIQNVAIDWHTQQLEQKPWLQNLYDYFFDVRRSWSKE